jgi:hypothetical protein
MPHPGASMQGLAMCRCVLVPFAKRADAPGMRGLAHAPISRQFSAPIDLPLHLKLTPYYISERLWIIMHMALETPGKTGGSIPMFAFSYLPRQMEE